MTVKRSFRDSMRKICGTSCVNPDTLANMVLVYTAGWIDSRKQLGDESAIASALDETRPIAEAVAEARESGGWEPDDSWRWWLQ